MTIKDKESKLTTNLIVGALALSDSFIGAISVPFVVFVKLTYSDYGWMPCAISPLVLAVPILCSMLTMVLIAFERYGSIVTNKPYPVKQIKIAIAIIWIGSLIAGLITYPLFFFIDRLCVITNIPFAHMLFISLLVAILTTFMVVTYVRIIRELNKKRVSLPNNPQRLKQTQQATRSFFMCYLWYVICFTPAQCLALVDIGLHEYGGIEKEYISAHDTYTISIILALFNSVMNPIVYAIFNIRMRYVISTTCLISIIHKFHT